MSELFKKCFIIASLKLKNNKDEKTQFPDAFGIGIHFIRM